MPRPESLIGDLLGSYWVQNPLKSGHWIFLSSRDETRFRENIARHCDCIEAMRSPRETKLTE